MRNFLFVAMALGASCSVLSEEAFDFLLRQEFNAFTAKYGKTYTASEEMTKFEVFRSNMENAARMNKETGTNVFGVTKFSDLEPAEFARQMLTYRPNGVNKGFPVEVSTSAMPSSFDWRDYGMVTPVKNQGSCGSCWAFSAEETIESAWAIAGNPLTQFSPQQIVSCDPESYGCGGGWTESAMDYVKSAGGLATEADYPYISGSFPSISHRCDESATISGGQVAGYTYATAPCTSGSCTTQNENEMAGNLAANQPLAICVDASNWSSYTGSGVFPTSKCSSSASKLDHCVQAVGYVSGQYWIVRNSWDTDWGDNGYIYLAWGVNACGIADDATMVEIA